MSSSGNKDSEKDKDKANKGKDKDKDKDKKKDKGGKDKDKGKDKDNKEEEAPPPPPPPEGPFAILDAAILTRILSLLPLATTIRAGSVTKGWYKESSRLLKEVDRLDFRSSFPQLDESILKHLLTKRVVADRLTECHLVSFPLLTDKCLKLVSEHCPNLTVLNISQSANITSEGLKFIGSKLTKLTALDVSHTPITEKGVRALTKLGGPLRTLSMADGSFVSDRSLEALPSLFPNLKVLDISRCPQIDDMCISALQQLAHLEELSMTWLRTLTPHGITRLCTPSSSSSSSTSTTTTAASATSASSTAAAANNASTPKSAKAAASADGTDADAGGSNGSKRSSDSSNSTAPPPPTTTAADGGQLSFFTSLRYLDVTGNELTDANVVLICRTFPNLQTLKVGWCEVSDEGLAAIKSLSRLENLGLEYTHVTQKGLRATASMTKLKCVQIYGTEISRKSRATYVTKNPGVKLVQHFLG